jgi:guanylate cyclase
MPTPYGLGWTSMFVGPELTRGLSHEEAYSRRLFVGLLALNTIALTLTSIGLAVTGSLVVMIAATATGAALSLALLVGFVAAPQRYVALVHTFLVLSTAISWASVPNEGGLADSGQPMWGILSIVAAVFLLGWRHAIPWFGVHVVLVLAFAWMGPFPTDLSREERVNTEIANQITFGFGMWVMAAWFLQQRKILAEGLRIERERTRLLLHSAVPESIANRLQAGERVADFHEDVGVLFADLSGFTAMSSELPASRVVELLSSIFDGADVLAAEHHLCKVKTIGDCYMVASNLPEPGEDHLTHLAQFALAFRDQIRGLRFDGYDVSLRLGIHVGHVLAGVIGRERLLYDLWGDTVNIASRMESTGEAGRIQVSERVERRLRERFELSFRGDVQAKGKGALKAYFLESERTP